MTRTIQVADLFCGAGGFSSGCLAAASAIGVKVELLAVNHWDVAIATHTANHADVTHMCQTLDSIDPRKAVPGGRLHLMMASPECTHHSNARGGKPMSDQSRASAWHILRWAEALYIENIVVENVPEFMNWGPLGAGGRPLKRHRGDLFRQFIKSLRALGYTVDHRILNSAYYGDATTRKRLFIMARRGRKITWPEPSHAPAEESQGNLFGETLPFRTAREVIDWTLHGKSIYGRKKSLAPATMERIYAGLRKFSGLPFVIGAGGQTGSGRPRSVEEPLGTVLTDDHRALCEPFIVVFRNNQDAQSIDRPLPTLTTMGANCGLCEPFIMAMEHSTDEQSRRCYSADRALPTITGKGQFALVDMELKPWILKHYNTSAPYSSIDDPLPTNTARENMSLIEPYLVEYHGSHTGKQDGAGRTRTVDAPLPTADTSNRFGLCQPFLVQYYGTGHAAGVDEPIGTLTTHDRYALCLPEMIDKGDKVYLLDIRFRMLQPNELAAAMSFPPGYKFEGNRNDKVKQIGNAVACRTAAALCGALIN